MDSLIVNDSGTYQLVVSDLNNGCADTTTATVEKNTGNAIAEVTDNDTITCSKSTDTLIGMNSTTGSGSINYNWSTNTGSIMNNLDSNIVVNDSGTYKLVIEDPVTGCKDSMSVSVDLDTTSPSLSTTKTDISCDSSCNGSINLTLNAGTSPFDFDWDNDGTGDFDDSEDINSLCAGTYKVIVNADNDCKDSTTVTIQDNSNSFDTVNASVCASYTVPSGDESYTTSGTYIDTLPNSEGCDSLITINLSINNSFDTINPSVCDSYTVPSGHETYTSSGNYSDTIPNSAGCDSIINIQLQIGQNKDT
ncbi:MAG: hypothetical protein ABEH43_00730, partial [Flavobacteriales bacterium]